MPLCVLGKCFTTGLQPVSDKVWFGLGWEWFGETIRYYVASPALEFPMQTILASNSDPLAAAS